MSLNSNPIVEVPVKLRLAEPADLKADDKTLKFGQPYWLKSSIDGKFDNKAYILSINTDPSEIKNWLERNMIYVPISDLDL